MSRVEPMMWLLVSSSRSRPATTTSGLARDQPAASIVEDIDSAGEDRCFQKTRGRNAARAKVCAVETAQEGPDHEYGLTLLAAFSFLCWLRWVPGTHSIATLSTKAASGDGAVSFITS